MADDKLDYGEIVGRSHGFFSNIGSAFEDNWSDGYQFGDFTKSLFGIDNSRKRDRENLQMQKDEVQYQHALQQQLFAREDSTIQRTIADAQKAGVHPLAALGMGGGAGEVVGTSAPQYSNSNSVASRNARVQEQLFSLQASKAHAEIANINADTNYKNALADDIPENALDRRTHADMAKINADVAWYDAKTKRLAEEADSLYKDRSASTAEKAQVTREFLADLDAKRVELESKLNHRQIVESAERANKLKEEVKLLVKQQGLVLSETELNKIQHDYYLADIDHMAKLNESIDFQMVLDEIRVGLDQSRLDLEEKHLENEKAQTNSSVIRSISNLVTMAIGLFTFGFGPHNIKAYSGTHMGF